MTVADLIQRLQACPPTARVFMYGSQDFLLKGRRFDAEVRDVLISHDGTQVELDNAPPIEVLQALDEFYAQQGVKRPPEEDYS